MLMLGSGRGVVVGDIGTSPIYRLRETFAGHHTLEPDAMHIYGVLSLIFWSMMIIVTLKYVTILLRADNKGEGGTLALLALINRSSGGSTRRWSAGIIMLGVFATALFYGDSMITPAISVLSAVEGLTTVNRGFEPYVLPIAIGILVGLFAIQSRGTATGRQSLRPGNDPLFLDPGRPRAQPCRDLSRPAPADAEPRQRPRFSTSPSPCPRLSPWVRSCWR
jgi:KUP system potassium uptake protein